MRIVNYDNLTIGSFTRVCDIDSGECFQFLDEDILYMRAGDFYICVADGEVYEDTYECNRPVRAVETELKILEIY